MKNWRTGWIAPVAVSVSGAPDMGEFGLGDGHLRDAMATIASKLLAFGYRLAYGGDLRPGGFTEQLFEFAARYGRGSPLNGRLAVIDYLAWPVHASMAPEAKRELVEGLTDVAEIAWLSRDGTPLEACESDEAPASDLDAAAWADGLTAMRRTMAANTSARLVLGGRVEQYRGAMPGIAEEAALAMESGQPVYLLGGFGGCTHDIVETMGLAEPRHLSQRDWAGRTWFAEHRDLPLNNGLSRDENRDLASTPHIDEAILLALTGLERVKPSLRRVW